MTQVTVSDAVVEALAAADVDVVFTLCGNHILPLQESLRTHGLRCVATRSEAAAVFAADAYGRVRRRAGVALVTGGPGVSNAATALLTARGNQSPLVLLSGEPSTAVAGRGAQQEADHVLLTAGATKASMRALRGDRVLEHLQEAFRLAEHGRTGPVHLTIPTDVQQQPLSVPAGGVVPARRAVQMPVAPAPFLSDVGDLLRAAARPVLVAGAGVWQHGGEAAVAELAERNGIPVFTLDSARGIAPDSAACIFGSADAGLNRAADGLASADCVIIAGREVDFRLGYGAFIQPDATVVHVHADTASLGRNLPQSTLLCSADPAAFVADLVPALDGYRAPSAWAEELAALRGDSALADAGSSNGDGSAHPASVAEAIARAGGAANAIFALDCGEFVQWCRSYIPSEAAGSWLRLGLQATCGAGLPFGIGAQAAAPDRPVVVIAGDGGIGYHVAELETAVRCGLPVVVVVGQDNAWGVELLLQTGLYGDDAAFTSELSQSDFAMVAKGFGCGAVTVDGPAEVEDALADALAAREPRLIQVGIRNVRSRATERMVASLRSSRGS
jgi:thiamine pyrophosphate-dependent acetolactate synthase large subunit-like protein